MRPLALGALNYLYDEVDLKCNTTARVVRQVDADSWQMIDVIQNNELSPLSLCGKSVQPRFKM